MLCEELNLFANAFFMKALSSMFLLNQNIDQEDFDEDADNEEGFLDEDFDEMEVDDEQEGESDTEFRHQFDAYMRAVAQQAVDIADLPETVKVLSGDDGEKVYVVGTAHFSMESCEDVRKVISMVQPDGVMVELCSARANILTLTKEYIEEIKKTSPIPRLRRFIKEKGVMSGLVVFLLQETSNSITSQLGMPPGEEMRTAHQEASKVRGCKLYLGDRAVDVTLKRTLHQLSFRDKLLLGLRMSKDIFTTISPEDIEEMKKKDIIENLLKELGLQFPQVVKVIVEERDLYLTAFIKEILKRRVEMPDGQTRAPVLVSVVGLGHQSGIVEHFGKMQNSEQLLKVLNKVPVKTQSRTTYFVLKTVKGTVFGAFTYLLYRALCWSDLFARCSSVAWIFST